MSVGRVDDNGEARLGDPDWYLGADVHERLAELRRTHPVRWTEMDGHRGFWAVLGHAEVVHVSRHPEVFSSTLGGVVLEDPDEATLEATRRMLLVMDPPEHTAHRRPLAPHFGARTIDELEPRRDDVTALLLDTIDDDVEFGSFFFQLVAAGNDTTRTLISFGVDVELGGVRIAAGDKVAVLYTSANRDEAVFADPQTFDVRRSPNPHLSFGIGAHFCLGAHVARRQARLFFEELLATWVVERTAEPTRLRSNLTNGYRRLPVRLGKGEPCAPGR